MAAHAVAAAHASLHRGPTIPTDAFGSVPWSFDQVSRARVAAGLCGYRACDSHAHPILAPTIARAGARSGLALGLHTGTLAGTSLMTVVIDTKEMSHETTL